MGEQDTLINQGLLTELAKEEVTLIEVGSQYVAARVRFDVASRKYAVVRDMVIDRLGYSPYRRGKAPWSKEAIQCITKMGGNLGKYRFVHMKTGDAAVAALKEASEPMTLEEIVGRMRTGSAPLPLPRMVNAALMKTTGIQKTEDGKYKYEEPEPEDIPF